MNPPLVAIFMVTYNQENYISQAIESILMQKTTFPVKIFVGEDCSTDKTGAICVKLQEENPEIIEVILNKQNIGASNNAKQIFENCFASGAKYIAMLEGDDYWTDPYKLQKQIDFMESNPEYSLTCHKYLILDQTTGEISKDNSHYLSIINKGELEFTKHDFLEHHIIQTLTVVFKKEYVDYKALNKTRVGDLAVYYSCLKNGPGYCFDFYGGVYRKHTSGIFSLQTNYDKSRMVFHFHKKMYSFTKDIIFEKPLNRYQDILWIYIKKSVLKSRMHFFDFLSILHVDFLQLKWGLMFRRIILVLYWRGKTYFEKSSYQ